MKIYRNLLHAGQNCKDLLHQQQQQQEISMEIFYDVIIEIINNSNERKLCKTLCWP